MQQVPAVRGILPVLRDSHLREIPSARKKINGLKLCKFKSGNAVCSVLPFSHFFRVFLPQAFVGMKLDSGQSFFSWVLGDMDLHAYTQKSSPTSLSLFAYCRYIFFFSCSQWISMNIANFSWQKWFITQLFLCKFKDTRDRSLLRDKLTWTLHAGDCFASYKWMWGGKKLTEKPHL